LAATGYALFSGWGVPAQRTVWMLAAVTWLRWQARHWPWALVWVTAGAVVLALDPWALLQPGFWLSFVAVGVLMASGQAAGTPMVHADGHWSGAWRALLVRMRALVREQWLVSLALAPLGVLFFGQISVLGLLANLLAIPWVSLLITPLALLGTLFSPLWSLAASLLMPLTGLQIGQQTQHRDLPEKQHPQRRQRQRNQPLLAHQGAHAHKQCTPRTRPVPISMHHRGACSLT
jgi:competence protein ComEC